MLLSTPKPENAKKNGHREKPQASPRVKRGPGGGLLVVRGDEEIPVQPARCFPWSSPTRYVSLRDKEGKEALLVRELAELDEDSRRALEGAIAEAGFAFEIKSIEHIEEEFEIFAWTVKTKQGGRLFQTARDEWPREIPGGGYVIRDVAGDLFTIRDPERLDAQSREYFWSMVD